MESPIHSFEAHFQTMKTDHNVVFTRGTGSKLWDTTGREYTDLCAGFGALALGHRPMSQVVADMQNFFNLPADALVHGLGDLYYSEAKLNLLKKLSSILPPPLHRFAFSLGGAGAVEIALKAAILKRRADGFISLKLGYHGLDFGSLQVTGQKRFRDPFEGMLQSEKVGFLDVPLQPSQFLESLETTLKEKFNSDTSRLAAVIVEPILGRGGVRPLGVEVLKALRNWTEKRGILLIFDEIFCGLGRAGVWSHATADCMPDISVFGKALGGGFPTSVCAMSEEVSRSWPDLGGEAIHTGTFFGHPFMANLAHFTLCEIEENQLLSRALTLGTKASDFLSSAFSGSMRVQIKGRGLMIGIDLKVPGAAVDLMHHLRDHCSIVAIPSGEFGEVLSVTPALNIPEEELFSALEKISKAIHLIL